MTGDVRKLKLVTGSQPSVPTPPQSAEAPPPPQQEKKPAALIYLFGPFELNMVRHELLRNQHRLSLAPAPMKLLHLFVERPGALIPREEIVSLLWSAPGMIDVDDGINAVIRRLRQILRDDTSKPRYIETVVGKGYRFIAEVKVVDPTQAPDSTSGDPLDQKESNAPAPEEQPTPLLEAPPVSQNQPVVASSDAKSSRIWPIFLAVLALLAIGYVAWRISRRPLRYTTALSQVTTNDAEQRVITAAISPDGKWIAYADINGIHLRLLQSGKTVRLNSPESLQPERLAWSPDQTRLVVSGNNTRSNDLEIWMVSITGAAPQLFRKDTRHGTPSPDGSRIAFLSADAREIWVAGVEGGTPSRIVPGIEGKSFSEIFWSADSKRISFIHNRDTGQKAEIYESADVATGKVLAEAEVFTFYSPVAMADGRIFYLADAPPHLGDDFSLWEVRTNPATGAFVSPPRQIATLPKEHAFALSGSEDGSRLSFIASKGSPHIYIAGLNFPGPGLGEAKLLTHDTRADYPHAWLHDNETVLFESDRVAPYRLYGQRLQAPEPHEFSTGSTPSVLPKVPPSGQWILFAMNPDTLMSPRSRLYRIPASGSAPPEEVNTAGPLQDFSCPLRSGSCILLEVEGRRLLRYFALDPVTGKGQELGRTSWVPHILGDWSVAPDGSAVALSIHDAGNPRLRIVPLTPSAGSEREIAIHAHGTPSGISYAADGKGWFVSLDKGTGTLMIYVDPQGNSRVLRDVPLGTWAVPSPDGTKIAFIDRAVDSNVWLWDVSAHR